MSQSGLLNEDEIKDYLNETFGLKLDRNALIRPTSDVVVDIYTRFLESHCKCRNRKTFGDEYEPNIKCMIHSYIRKAVANYNINFTFSLADLLTPTRKRTTAFLNVLIYVCAQVQDTSAISQQIKNELAVEHEAIENVKRERSNRKLAIEELAYKIATSKPIEELSNEKEEKERVFNQLKKLCDDRREKGMHVKASKQVLSENNARRKAQREASDREIDELQKQLQMLNDGQGIKKKIQDMERTLQSTVEQVNNLKETQYGTQKRIDASNRFVHIRRSNNDRRTKVVDSRIRLLMRSADEKEASKSTLEQELSDLSKTKAVETSSQAELTNLERLRTKSRLQFKTKEQQLLVDRNAKAKQREEFVQQSEAVRVQLRRESERIRKETAEEKAKQKAISEQCEVFVEKANRQIEQAESYVKSKRDGMSKDTSVTNHIKKLENLLGKPKEVELPPNPSNRTYIKESYELEVPKNLTFNKTGL